MLSKLSVTAKIYILTLSLVTLLAAIPLVVFVNRMQEERQKAISEHIDSILQLQRRALASTLWDYDAKSVSTLVAGIVRDSYVVKGVVKDPKGKLVTQSTDPNVEKLDPTYFKEIKRPLIYYAGSEGNQEETSVGTLFVTISMEKVILEQRADFIFAFIAVLLTALLTFLVLLLSLRMLTAPLNRLTGVLSQFAKGDTSIQVPYLMRGDILGEVAKVAQAFKDATLESRQLERDQLKAEERLKKERERTSAELSEKFEREISDIVDSSSEAMEKLSGAAQVMREVTSDTAEKATETEHVAHQVSESSAIIATSIEELTVSIQEIATQISASTVKAKAAVQDADRANGQMRGLSSAAEKISEVVTLITEITEKTNLLALNATIEAARAGEAGKGFAIVAQEVKALANQTAKATDDISQHVARVQTETQDAVEAISAIGDTILEISEVSTSISASVEEQTSATSEISQAIQSASTGTNKMVNNMGGVTEAMRQTNEAVETVVDGTTSLSSRLGELRHKVSSFLEDTSASSTLT